MQEAVRVWAGSLSKLECIGSSSKSGYDTVAKASDGLLLADVGSNIPSFCRYYNHVAVYCNYRGGNTQGFKVSGFSGLGFRVWGSGYDNDSFSAGLLEVLLSENHEVLVKRTW